MVIYYPSIHYPKGVAVGVSQTPDGVFEKLRTMFFLKFSSPTGPVPSSEDYWPVLAAGRDAGRHPEACHTVGECFRIHRKHSKANTFLGVALSGAKDRNDRHFEAKVRLSLALLGQSRKNYAGAAGQAEKGLAALKAGGVGDGILRRRLEAVYSSASEMLVRQPMRNQARNLVRRLLGIDEELPETA